MSHLLRFKQVAACKLGTETDGAPAVALQLSFQGLPLPAHAFVDVSSSSCVPHELSFATITFGLVSLTCLPPSLKPYLHS